MPESYLEETFEKAAFDTRLQWRHAPKVWKIDTEANVLRLTPDAKTDYWQRTHYGFQADNGPFLFAEVAGDFVLATHARFQPANQYDQAGLLIHLSPDCWLKTSVEYEQGGPNRLGAVVTNHGYSDWSTQDYPGDLQEIWLRVRREAADYIVESSGDGEAWTQIRLAHLHEDREGAPVACGLYACSPIESGYIAEFSFLKIEKGRLPSHE